MYEDDMRLEAYILPENLKQIREGMPTSVTINHWQYDVHYADDEYATPFISNFPLELAKLLRENEKLTLGDGREVLFHYNYGDDDDRYLRASDVRHMAGR